MLTPFEYRGGTLYCEEVEVERIAAAAGTPIYIYSASAIRARFKEYDQALAGVPHRVC